MKGLSIRQPWAWLIMHGGKDVENRVWNYVPKLKGRIYIHAAAGCTVDEYNDGCWFAKDVWAKLERPPLEIPARAVIERGGIIGTAEITEYLVSDYHNPNPWYLGGLGIVLSNPEPCKFRPLKGMLGFFDVP